MQNSNFLPEETFKSIHSVIKDNIEKPPSCTKAFFSSTQRSTVRSRNTCIFFPMATVCGIDWLAVSVHQRALFLFAITNSIHCTPSRNSEPETELSRVPAGLCTHPYHSCRATTRNNRTGHQQGSRQGAGQEGGYDVTKAETPHNIKPMM